MSTPKEGDGGGNGVKLIQNGDRCVGRFIHQMCARSRGEGIPQRGLHVTVGISRVVQHKY